MNDRYTETRQSEIWRSDFGDSYTERNEVTPEKLNARIDLWSKIIETIVRSQQPSSILEVGANIGINLLALKNITSAELFAVEPNELARARLLEKDIMPTANVNNCLAHELSFSDRSIDLVFTSGVLIHIHPDNLLNSCQEIHRVTRRYIVCIEYFSDKPEQIDYRGVGDILFKRDYGSFWLDNFADLSVIGYGFVWKRFTGLDNLTWWAFEKAA